MTDMKQKQNKIVVIALFGKSGAGKDYLIKTLPPNEYHKIIPTTTRPKRDYEVNGVDYHFITVGDMTAKVLQGDMIEVTDFNNWFYGTEFSELKEDKINIGIFNIHAIECILQDERLEVYPIYINSSPKTRLLRALNREDEPDCLEICRRFLADEKDFDDIDFIYNTYWNEKDFTPYLDKIIKDIIAKIDI